VNEGEHLFNNESSSFATTTLFAVATTTKVSLPLVIWLIVEANGRHKVMIRRLAVISYTPSTFDITIITIITTTLRLAARRVGSRRGGITRGLIVFMAVASHCSGFDSWSLLGLPRLLSWGIHSILNLLHLR